MNNPKAPNTTDPSQAMRAASIHTWVDISALPLSLPATLTAATDSPPKASATIALVAM